MSVKKVGLALGGGSARGFAHLGVIQVFEEENIPIDYLAGCSMGALLGGIYASGCPLGELTERAKTFHALKYLDIAPPFISDGDLRGNRVKQLLKEMTDDVSFEDAKIPFRCLATCIEDGEGYYFSSGKLYEAIRASISLPHIFEPVILDGKTLVDGGMIDRSGISALELLSPDVIIASDVDYHGGPLPTPKTKREVVGYSYDILSRKAVAPRYKNADVTICSDIPLSVGNRYSDREIPHIIEAGVKAARAALPDIKKALEG